MKKSKWSEADRQRHADGDRLKASAISGKRRPAPETHEWEEEPPRWRKRVFDDPTCALCTADWKGFHPPHQPSDRCQSGKRQHCSCDTCF